MIRKVDGWWYQASAANADTGEFDIAFWQAQGPAVIFASAWEMVLDAHKLKGGHPDELRLQRPDFVLKPIQR
jgi:hypothetical protein